MWLFLLGVSFGSLFVWTINQGRKYLAIYTLVTIIVLAGALAWGAGDYRQRDAARQDALADYYSGELSEPGLLAKLKELDPLDKYLATKMDSIKQRPYQLNVREDPVTRERLYGWTVRDGSNLERVILYRCARVKVIRPR